MRSTTGRASKWLVIAIAGVSVVVAGVLFYLAVWDRYIEAGLGRWAVAEVSERSRGVYRLVLGDLDFRPLAGSMSFDSAVVSTDTALNRTLDAPAPLLSARAVSCRLSNVSVVRLMVQKRFEAGAMGCDGVFTAIELPPLKATLGGQAVRPLIRVYSVGVVSVTLRASVEATSLRELVPLHRGALEGGRTLDQVARELCDQACQGLREAMIQPAGPGCDIV